MTIKQTNIKGGSDPTMGMPAPGLLNQQPTPQGMLSQSPTPMAGQDLSDPSMHIYNASLQGIRTQQYNRPDLYSGERPNTNGMSATKQFLTALASPPIPKSAAELGAEGNKGLASGAMQNWIYTSQAKADALAAARAEAEASATDTDDTASTPAVTDTVVPGSGEGAGSDTVMAAADKAQLAAAAAEVEADPQSAEAQSRFGQVMTDFGDRYAKSLLGATLVGLGYKALGPVGALVGLYSQDVYDYIKSFFSDETEETPAPTSLAAPKGVPAPSPAVTTPVDFPTPSEPTPLGNQSGGNQSGTSDGGGDTGDGDRPGAPNSQFGGSRQNGDSGGYGGGDIGDGRQKKKPLQLSKTGKANLQMIFNKGAA